MYNGSNTGDGNELFENLVSSTRATCIAEKFLKGQALTDLNKARAYCGVKPYEGEAE